MSLIARTAAIGRQAEELQWDLNYLLQGPPLKVQPSSNPALS